MSDGITEARRGTYWKSNKYEQLNKENNMKQLWYFSAPWCQPCQTFGPIMDQVAEKGIHVHKVNVDYEPNASTTYGVKSVPTIILVENGKEKARFVGARPLNEVLNFYNQ
jgi:thioredoxin 1